MNWPDFFAAGKAVFVDQTLDLIDIAAAMHNDETDRIQTLMSKSQVGLVTDAQAMLWSEKNTELWAVVTSPWVLIQEPRS